MRRKNTAQNENVLQRENTRERQRRISLTRGTQRGEDQQSAPAAVQETDENKKRLAGKGRFYSIITNSLVRCFIPLRLSGCFDTLYVAVLHRPETSERVSGAQKRASLYAFSCPSFALKPMMTEKTLACHLRVQFPMQWEKVKQPPPNPANVEPLPVATRVRYLRRGELRGTCRC